MTHVADLEAEMIRRDMTFELIAWDKQLTLPSDGNAT
jgi:hypothetical protein